MTEEKDKFRVEDAFEELEQIILQLESDDVPLKESIVLYGRGAKLLAKCRDELTGIEKEMIIIGEAFEQGEEEYEF